MNLMHVSLAFTIGFLLGGLACYIAYSKLFSKHHLQDELTNTRRELANSKRALNDFFVNADSLFVLLDKNYRQFAALMAEAASRLNQSPDLFELNRDNVQRPKAAAAKTEEEQAADAEEAEIAERKAQLKQDKEAKKAEAEKDGDAEKAPGKAKAGKAESKAPADEKPEPEA
ncbi:MAG: DUF1043 family protein, partial [Proteobacteria bacterium]|nr:DUF1043 family protein [Candidatus Avisuccinivibrio stercorigallinarum]